MSKTPIHCTMFLSYVALWVSRSTDLTTRTLNVSIKYEAYRKMFPTNLTQTDRQTDRRTYLNCVKIWFWLKTHIHLMGSLKLPSNLHPPLTKKCKTQKVSARGMVTTDYKHKSKVRMITCTRQTNLTT